MIDAASELSTAPAPARPDVAAAPAPALDFRTYQDKDRRTNLEGIIELSRAVILIVAAVSNNFPGRTSQYTAAANLILGAWAVFNLGTTLALVAHRLPGRLSQSVHLVVDVAVASALVYFSGGVNSSLGIAFYVVIIAGCLRFGLRGALLSATLISAAFVAVDIAAAGGIDSQLLLLIASRLFLFYVVALTAGLLAQEMIRARVRQLQRTYELEHAAFRELREVDRIKSDFMMLASHELRTPLTKIKAWVTLMQTLGDDISPSAQAEGFQELRTEAEQLARLTDNLLCIAQLESGEIHLKTNATSVDVVVRDVLGRFVETADRSRFVCSIDPDAQEVLADSERLALILACLVDNALKFSPSTERVKIEAHRAATEVHIEIKDGGKKIPEDQADKIFASFYQVEAPLNRQRNGSGVGLYLARQLAERMGGNVWIDDKEPRGNTFVVSLPTRN